MSVEYVNIHGNITNYKDIDKVYLKIKSLITEHLDFSENIDEIIKKINDDIVFDIYECYGYYGAITNYFEKEILKDFPGIIFHYGVEIYWDNGEIENFHLDCDGKNIKSKDDEYLVERV